MQQVAVSKRRSIAHMAAYGPAHTVVHPDLRALLALWEERSGKDEFPPPGSITPRDMMPFLHRISLFSVLEDSRDFEVRVLGRVTSDGLRLTPSRRLSEAADLRVGTVERLTKHCRHIVSERRAFRVSADLPTIASHDEKRGFEALWLPIGRDGRIEQVLLGSVTRKYC